MTLDGHPGLFLAPGYWFDLTNYSWQRVQGVPQVQIGNQPVNALTTFRGLPTVFGNNECDDEFQCRFDEVIQYDPSTDTWVRIGQLAMERKEHAVVEVPIAFCARYVDITDAEDGAAEIEGAHAVALILSSVLLVLVSQ